MSINVPQSVFDKYFEVIDSTFDIFGVTCQLVSIEKREIIIDDPDDNLPIINTINDHRRNGGGDKKRGTKVIREVEVLTDIKLKVYWDTKQWIQIADALSIPNASIQTIGFMSDFNKIVSAKSLLVHKGIKDTVDMRFERVGNPIPTGLKADRYFACFWKRIS
tara:strand:- start:64 stop:552 length:489 start_codon:yes stop_codon:yes gene_type:complete